mmetsp:Transcript_18119/g.50025  ORF Transcript_18119/g.50025 Transcript_18119/m.50025 type:complete len:144 (+) Transcript_18119:54-485(+)
MMNRTDDAEMASNAGASDITGTEMYYLPSIRAQQHQARDGDGIFIYAFIGIAAVAICVFGLHAGVSKVLFPQAAHHHWSGTASVSNDVRLEPIIEHHDDANVVALGDPDIATKNEEILEHQLRQARHKIHIHLLAMEKAARRS